MNKLELTPIQLLQELEQKIKQNQIGFWIENQDCYLWENTFHYSNKIKIGNLSQTKEKWWIDWMAKFDQYYQESEIRRKILERQFQDISDVDLVEELKRREKNIKLTKYSNQDHVYLEATDIKSGIYFSLPLTVKKEKEHE